MQKAIKSALISVFDKGGLPQILRALALGKITLYSTGGTERYIRELGYAVHPVEELTKFPSILDGRVKTLHPGVFAGILARRSSAEHLNELRDYEYPEIDLVIVDLYPFEKTVHSGGSHEEIIEKIDVGGVSLLRAAAKNYEDVLVISSRFQYDALASILAGAAEENRTDQENAGEHQNTVQQRSKYAAEAFKVTARYDGAIADYFSSKVSITAPEPQQIVLGDSHSLRYGENPHQKGTFYGNTDDLFIQESGRKLSYNNLVDIDSALKLIAEFKEEPNAATFAILKHTNACGAATRKTLLEAWKASLSADPISAFGGVLVCNRAVDLETASEIHKLFFEVLIAPDFDPLALQELASKKNRIILRTHATMRPSTEYKSLLNGILSQDQDASLEDLHLMKVATDRVPTEEELTDLTFALKLVKHSKSNAIVLSKKSMMLGSGIGQTSRVDALKQSIHKAVKVGFDLTGAVMASDAFFPFPDSIQLAAGAGITSIVQPGGSIKDEEVIAAANRNGLSMVVTGMRHFKH